MSDLPPVASPAPPSLIASSTTPSTSFTRSTSATSKSSGPSSSDMTAYNASLVFPSPISSHRWSKSSLYNRVLWIQTGIEPIIVIFVKIATEKRHISNRQSESTLLVRLLNAEQIFPILGNLGKRDGHPDFAVPTLAHDVLLPVPGRQVHGGFGVSPGPVRRLVIPCGRSPTTQYPRGVPGSLTTLEQKSQSPKRTRHYETVHWDVINGTLVAGKLANPQ
ncbi:somatostatin receptor type 4 [Plakobranchus ocellatus]|uniref:Somatostatin receptor type 4 n=1 Tax=Plakobranchus ocellatus TaxID=259542 RepID=A0AAV3XWB4_9GAST|nr:somatostatin receptor type 4 [Plakobranchus ocellatus]